jgi:hypothetical protein
MSSTNGEKLKKKIAEWFIKDMNDSLGAAIPCDHIEKIIENIAKEKTDSLIKECFSDWTGF